MGRKNPIAAVYMIRCAVNGKIYFGETSNLVDRFSAYRTAGRGRVGNGPLPPIYRAIQKHGIDNFIFTPIVTEMTNPKVKDDIYRRTLEARYIYRYNSADPMIGYNLQVSSIRRNHKGPTAGYPADTSTRLLKSDPVIAYNFDTKDVFMCTSSKTAADMFGIDKAIVARCCKNGKSTHNHQFFKLDYDKRKEYAFKIIKDKSVKYDPRGRATNSLRKKSLQRYFEALNAANNWCKYWGYKPLNIDELINDAMLSKCVE